MNLIEPRGDLVGAILDQNGIDDPLEREEIVSGNERLVDLSVVDRVAVDDLVLSAKRIVVHADYDTDGICSGNVLVLTGLVDFVFVPDRIYGYGVRPSFAELLSAGDLLITVDCGTSDASALEEIMSRGVSVLVTDHHEAGSKLPSCPVYNPSVSDFAFRHYSGASVAFHVFHHLLGPNLDYALQFVALSTVADVMPMRGPNRHIVREGLRSIRDKPHPVIASVLAAGDVDPRHVTEYDLGWKASPIVNSMSRMERYDMADWIANGTAPDGLSNELRSVNELRKELIRTSAEEVAQHISSQNGVHAVVVDNYQTGFTGLLATKLARDMGGLCIVATQSTADEDLLVGSMRSDTSNCHAAIRSVRHLIESGGGHVGAAGFRVRTENFWQMVETIRQNITTRSLPTKPKPFIHMDVNSAVANIETIESLSPYGHSFPEPTFFSESEHITHVRYVGKQRFPTFQISGHRAILFEPKMEVQEGCRANVTFRVRKSWFRGQGRTDVEILSLKPLRSATRP